MGKRYYIREKGDLSRDFSLRDFIKKEDYFRIDLHVPGIRGTIEKKLVNPILQPLSDFLKIEIQIKEGYRSDACNQKTGGKEYSHHLFRGDRSACDFICADMQGAWDWLSLKRNKFCYAYWDKKENHIHISGLTNTDRRIGIMWIIDPSEGFIA